MTTQQDDPWVIRAGIYWVFAIGVVTGLAAALFTSLISSFSWTFLSIFFVSLGCGLSAVILSLIWVFLLFFFTKTPTQDTPLPDPILLKEFLNTPAATIAPNLPPSKSAKLAEWLIEFRILHGNNSVWVIPFPDGPDAERVIFCVNNLSPNEQKTLQSFHVDNITTLPKETQQQLFPNSSSKIRFIEAFGD